MFRPEHSEETFNRFIELLKLGQGVPSGTFPPLLGSFEVLRSLTLLLDCGRLDPFGFLSHNWP